MYPNLVFTIENYSSTNSSVNVDVERSGVREKTEGELLKSAHERNEDLIAFWTNRLSARTGIKSCHCVYLSVITLYVCIVIVFVIL